MNLKLKNNLVIVEGHYNSLSLGIFDKTKLIKVKNYNFQLINNNEDLFFNSVKDSWNIHGVGQGRMKTCATKCNVGFDPFVAQWQ